MTKLYFYYASMNSGKSSHLLQAAFNYNERNMDVLVFIPHVIGNDYIFSRIGLKRDAIVFDHMENLYTHVSREMTENNTKYSCILIDEAQFLTKEQVLQLCKIVDILNIPVLSYGLRSDFKGEPFEGSKYLLILADKLIELKTICVCGKKAIMNMRKKNDNENSNGVTPILEGEQIDIGSDKYISLCRKCYSELINLSSKPNILNL